MPQTQQDLVTARRAQVLEILDTVFDVACHQEPLCAERWRRVQDGVKTTLKDTWDYQETRGIQSDI